MKRRVWGLALFLLCLLAFTPVAHAEDVKVKVSAAPTELSEAGTVDFSFEISNNSIYELHNITIAYMGETVDVLERFNLPPLAIGGSVSGIVLPFTVSDAQLGQPLTFTVSWLQGGEPFTQDVQCTVARAANPVISVTRTVSAEMAKQGDTITLTYELKNETKFDMSDIVLIDENISDNPILRLDALKANGTSTMTHQYRMGTEDVVSAPVVTYVVNGKSKVSSAVTPLTLSMMLIKLDMKVDAGMPTQGGVTFTLEIKNTGNQEIRNIQITDERGNPVNSSVFSLRTGETVTYPYLVVPVMTEAIRKVSFKLTGIDAFEQPYTLDTGESYEVYPFVDESQINVMMRAETVTPWSADTGTVTARIIVTNYSTVALTNILVSESTIGMIKSLDTLPAGETSFDQELLVGSPRNLQFTLKGNDPTGTTRDLSDCLLPVAYAAESAAPAATASPVQGQGPTRAFAFLSTTISKILVALGILMVLAFVALIVLSVMERSRGSRIRFDEDDEDEDEFDAVFASDPPASYEEDEQESEVEYFTKRIARAEAAVPARPEPKREVISLPAPAIPIEYDAVPTPAMSDDILNEIELHTADIMQENRFIDVVPEEDAEADVDMPPEAEAFDPPVDPQSLPTPKVIATRPQPATQPLSRKQIRYIKRDDKDR